MAILFISSNANFPPNNGAVLDIAQIIKAVMTSVDEAKIGAMFINTQETVPTGKNIGRNGLSPTKNTHAYRQLGFPLCSDKQRPSQAH